MRRDLVTVAAAVGRRPDLWPIAARATLDHVPRRWWRRRPFLPLPDRGWLRFRLVAAYGGDGDRRPQPDDVITWLEWRRRFGR
ncbi:MAG: hypothetical protein ACFCVK_25180 [Acidimicrobiales bacterium]